MPGGGLNALADAFGRDPENNDEDFIRRSLVPYAIAGAQLGHQRTAGRQAIQQQYGAYTRDIRGNQRGYVRRRNSIDPMIGDQRDFAFGQVAGQEQYGMGDMAAQGFAPTANFQGSTNNANATIAGLADRQRSYMADMRVADAAQWRDTRNTGQLLLQAGRTAVQQAYADAMARLMLQRLQSQLQLRQQLGIA